MGFASIGAGLHAKTVSCLFAVLGYKLNPQQAVDLPGLEGLTYNTDGSLPRNLDTTEFKTDGIKRANELGGGGKAVHYIKMHCWL